MVSNLQSSLQTIEQRLSNVNYVEMLPPHNTDIINMSCDDVSKEIIRAYIAQLKQVSVVCRKCFKVLSQVVSINIGRNIIYKVRK